MRCLLVYMRLRSDFYSVLVELHAVVGLLMKLVGFDAVK